MRIRYPRLGFDVVKTSRTTKVCSHGGQAILSNVMNNGLVLNGIFPSPYRISIYAGTLNNPLKRVNLILQSVRID